MMFASAVSTLPETGAAVAEVARAVGESLPGDLDLAVVFFSTHHAETLDELGPGLAQRLSAKHLIGCTGESIVARRQELEMTPAVSLWAAQLPDVDIVPLRLKFERTPEGGSIVGWPDELLGDWPEESTLLLLGEPFTFPADYLLERMAEDRPGLPIIGGMASGGGSPGENRLLLDGEVHNEGAVALRISGRVKVTSVVSQGCRPVGRPLVITKADKNVLLELGGQPAVARLQEVFQQLPTSEQQLAQRGLHIGLVADEYQEHREQGDFLIRNVLGFDQNLGAIAVADFVRPGQTVQFQIRDERSADADLRELLSRAKQASPQAGLLFTCNGRGTRLFSQPHHDAAAIAETLGDIPLAGLFAQGEIGPVAGRNFLHGFTASVALFGQ